MAGDKYARQCDRDYAALSAAGNPLAGLIAAFDAEAARYLDKTAPQSHGAHGGCPGGLMIDCAEDSAATVPA